MFTESITDVVQVEAKLIDALQDFQLVHSLCWGTESGIGALILIKLHEEHPYCILYTYSIVSSPKVSDAVVEPDNCVLFFHHFNESLYMVFCMDNEALNDIYTRTLKLQVLIYGYHLNHLVSGVISCTSFSLRFSGLLNYDLRKLTVNIISFPCIYFFIVCSHHFYRKALRNSNIR